MKSIGIFGGTFDPIHHGHLITAQAVQEIRGLEKIIFIPAFISPHKTEGEHSAPEHRLRMLHLSFEDGNDFEVDDFEINKKEISYTIDTLHYLKEKYENIELIIGYDNLLVFDKWKAPDEIIKLANLVVLKREVETGEKKNKYFDEAVFVETPAIEISATEIRRRIKEGLSVNYLVPQTVKKYIYDFNLYKE